MLDKTKGWHWEDIKAELRKRGWSLNRIGRQHGYVDPSTPRKVRVQTWPLMERVIADLLEVQPQDIWPERYRPDGSPKGIGIRGQYIKFPRAGNGNRQGAA